MHVKLTVCISLMQLQKESLKKNSGSLGLEPLPLQPVLQSGQNEIGIFDTQVKHN